MIRTELSLRLANSPGALAGVCRLLSNERVNIVAMMLESSGQLRLVVDNHTHGGAVLREQHYQVAEKDVIVSNMPNAPGALASVLRLLADGGVNLDYSYSGVADGGPLATVVFGVPDATRAAAAAGV
jgi:hypothetical protein